MPTTQPLLRTQYDPLSDLVITLSGAVDGSGNPLTNATAACKVTVGAGNWSDTSIESAQAMTYSGTPGTFTFTVPAASLPRGTMVYIQAQIYDSTGTTLHWTSFGQLVPAA